MKIGQDTIGPGTPCYVVAELGINHNGDLDTAIRLMNVAERCGANAVKFQKRTVDLVYTPEELAAPRESPFGSTNGDLKRGLEFGEREYALIAERAEELDIAWFASPWDRESHQFLIRAGAEAIKVPSALLTDRELLADIAGGELPVILATGMSTQAEIDTAVHVLQPDWDYPPDLALLACTAAYPAQAYDLHLRRIPTLARLYNCPVGWSGHEVGVYTSVAAVALGACIVERHLTLDRAMWGSDHAASLEPKGFAKMIEEIRTLELALGEPEIRFLDCEAPAAAKLRKVK